MEQGLYRSKTDRYLFGVCGGIAERYQMESRTVRIIFVIAGIFFGVSLIIYLILALLLPEKSSGEAQ